MRKFIENEDERVRVSEAGYIIGREECADDEKPSEGCAADSASDEG